MRVHCTDGIAGVQLRVHGDIDLKTGREDAVAAGCPHLHVEDILDPDIRGLDIRLNLFDVLIVDALVGQRDRIIAGLCAFCDGEFQNEEVAAHHEGLLCEVIAERKPVFAGCALDRRGIICRCNVCIILDIGERQRGAVPFDVDDAGGIAGIDRACDRHCDFVACSAFCCCRLGFEFQIGGGKCLQRCGCQQECCG